MGSPPLSFRGFSHELAVDHSLEGDLGSLTLIVGSGSLEDPLVGLLSERCLSAALESEGLQHEEEFENNHFPPCESLSWFQGRSLDLDRPRLVLA